MNTYNTLYLDPPFGKMTWEDLARLPVPAWTQPDALLFLWARTRWLEHAMLFIRQWGFHFVHLIDWMPSRKVQAPNVWDGFVCEHLMVGARGTVDLSCFHKENLFEWEPEKGGYHPQFIRDRVEEVGDWAFARARLLDVFGSYWAADDAEYYKDQWDFVDGLVV